MTQPIEAVLTWHSPAEGGRATPPTGPRFSTVARFEAERVPFEVEAWSLVIDFLTPPDSARTHRVHVRFLADGPAEYLAPGRTFELLDGRRRIAIGRVCT